ncbi:MAG: site-2 protease family protein, partial [Candidatus Omnitrophica bacterium]|nr:site-2 protease family protein [Candidatus Omnitrophota bacterium]
MIINILAVLVVFGVVIIIHELGHLLVAKKVGIKVENFSFGLGPALFKFKKGETTYQISLFPIGGAVKLAGEYPEEKEKTKKEEGSHLVNGREYFSKSPGIRALVVGAGPFNNILLGFLIFVFVFMLGVESFDFASTKIGNLIKDAPAARSGLQKDDTILMIN